MASLEPLDRAFYAAPTISIAKSLLGHSLVSTIGNTLTAGLILETEAYLVNDPASHAYRHKTLRNAIMFGKAGFTYVYLSYGIHTCMNVVTGTEGSAEGVLIRVLLPTLGITSMRERRKSSALESMLCTGPGNLCVSLGITLTMYGHDLRLNPLFIAKTPEQEFKTFLNTHQILERPRIGISQGQGRLLRFTAVPVE